MFRGLDAAVRAAIPLAAVAVLVWLAARPCPDGAVRLRSGTVSGPEELSSEGGPAIVKFADGITPDARRAVEELGAHLEAYVGDDAFLARLPPGVADRLPGSVWAAPYRPGLRLAPELVSLADETGTVPITVVLSSDADTTRTASRLTAAGLTVLATIEARPARGRMAAQPGHLRVLADGDARRLLRDDVARWPETLWISGPNAYELLQRERRGGHRRPRWTFPIHDRGLSGEGQIIGVFDSGIDAGSCYFRDEIHGPPPVVVGLDTGRPDLRQRKVIVVDFLWPTDDPADPLAWDDVGHGTHVAGTAAGNSLEGSPGWDQGDGVAPAAKLVIQDGGDAINACDRGEPGCLMSDLYSVFQQAWRQGARVHSNSFGDLLIPPYNLYSEAAAAADAMQWDHPDMLVLFAAGNGGPAVGTVGSPSTAKNGLSVGATLPGRWAERLWMPSGHGPTHDGRIKPDVTAPGVTVAAAGDGNARTVGCDTEVLAGTSFACPMAAGFAALVREYWERGFWPTGEPRREDALRPSGALVKATMLLAAAPMKSLVVPPPSNQQGWGRIVLDDALYFAGDGVRLFAVDVLERFESPGDAADTHTIEVAEGGFPLRIVLAWTDYPSTPAAAVNLVNDLDLEVRSPSGAIYRGNVFVNGSSIAGGQPDRRNNVEAVRVENAQRGPWSVRIQPRSVPQPKQGYALAATGHLLQQP